MAFKGPLALLKQITPPRVWEKVRQAFLFRPNDPTNLEQILPPRANPTSVERIKGFRYPSPGSRVGARIPTLESEDEIFDVNHYTKDSRNVPRDDTVFINGSQLTHLNLDEQRLPSHGKRKITLLPYDPTGLRTTKTTTWEALNKAIAKNATPNHLPAPEWFPFYEAIQAERVKKGLPAAIGTRVKYDETPSDYNELRW